MPGPFGRCMVIGNVILVASPIEAGGGRESSIGHPDRQKECIYISVEGIDSSAGSTVENSSLAASRSSITRWIASLAS